MAADANRTVSVTVERTSNGTFRALNARGGELAFGAGETRDFTPVELLLTAIAGCSGIDVDILTSRRAEPETFSVRVDATKSRDSSGNRLTDLMMAFCVRFPDGDAGDAARELLPVAVQKSHERLCIVSRTVETGAPIATRIDAPDES
jgi:uncharacterized OsmC-like protein